MKLNIERLQSRYNNKEPLIAKGWKKQQSHLHHQRGRHPSHRGSAHSKPGKTLYIWSLRQGYGENHPLAAVRRPFQDRRKPATWKVQERRRSMQNLVAECRESGWSVRLYPVEVGARGFVGRSTSCLLKDLGLRGATLSTDPPKSSLRKRRKQATGSGWNDETRLRHLIRFCCRGCQGEVPVHCPANRRRSGLRGETSMSGGLQLKTLQQNHTVCSQV